MKLFEPGIIVIGGGGQEPLQQLSVFFSLLYLDFLSLQWSVLAISFFRENNLFHRDSYIDFFGLWSFSLPLPKN